MADGIPFGIPPVPGATAGNFPVLASGGNLADSGKSTSSFAQVANNLSDIASAATALSNLGGLPLAGGTVTGNLIITPGELEIATGSAISIGFQPIRTANWTVQEQSGSEILQFLNTDGGLAIQFTSTAGAIFADAIELGGAKVQLDSLSFIQSDLAGNVTINANNPTGAITLDGATVSVPNGLYGLQMYYPLLYKPIQSNTPPASSSGTGTQWMMTVDSNFIYLCIAANTWKRVALATF